ncbi:MAG: cell division protein CrgA [Nocardioidaceae bacterium]
MPESRLRKKKKRKTSSSAGGGTTASTPAKVGSGRWVVPTMCTLLLLGLAWIVVYYLAGADVPGMRKFGDWNLMIGMGAILLGLLTAMKWE